MIFVKKRAIIQKIRRSFNEKILGKFKNNIPSDEESQHKYAEKTNVLFFVHRFGYYLHFAYNLLCDGCVFVFKAAFKPMSVNDA